MELIFDQVCINEEKASECFEPDRFLQKPLHMRIQYIMEKKVSFWMGGQEVDIRSALNNYRKWSALKGATTTTRI